MKKVLIGLTVILQLNGMAQDAKMSLFFKINVNELTPKSSADLDSLMDLGNLTDIKLVGFADSRGSDSMNLLLSQSRVKAVESSLTSNGYTVDETSFFGEQYPANSKNESNYAFWRRVDLSYSVDESRPKKLSQIDIDDIKSGKLEAIPLQLEFYNMSAEFMPYSTSELEKLLAFMQNNVTVNAFIRGHVCCSGGDIADYYSNLRAEAVYQYLIRKGISEERLSFQGFGNSQPLVWPEVTEEDQQRNRRVDVVFSIE
jgi:outer membrane protein OmpA-like peptidoglycan-associated protein